MIAAPQAADVTAIAEAAAVTAIAGVMSPRRTRQSAAREQRPAARPGSTLPPDRTMPTRWPANRSRWVSTAASATADDGSTICLVRCQSRRIAATVSRSSTFSTSTRCWRSRAKLGSPSVPRRPSQIVSGVNSVTRSPRCSDAQVSAAPLGSARYSRVSRRQRGGAERRAGGEAAAADRHDQRVERRHRWQAVPARRCPGRRSRARRYTGCTSSAPVSACTCAHLASRAAMVAAQRCSVAP